MTAIPEVLPGDLVSLRRYRPSDVDALKASLDASFDELHQWMDWAAEPATVATTTRFIEESIADFGLFGSPEQETSFAITVDEDRIVGSCGLMPHIGPDALEIGYWVDTRFTGRGIATEAAKMLAAAAFALPHIERIQIHCDEANERSAAVARKVGCTLERIQDKERAAPGMTGRQMIWVLRRDRP